MNLAPQKLLGKAKHTLKKDSILKIKNYTAAALIIVIAAIILCIFKPKTSASTLNYLSKVEQSMILHPDSSLLYLRAFDQKRLKCKEAKAKYALLYSQALDKNYIDLTTDSIIRVAVDYYSKRGTALEKTKSYYYLGAIYRNSKDTKRAAEAYLKALKHGMESNDKSLLGLIYNALGRQYFYQKDFNKATAYYKKAEVYFRDMGDAKNYMYTVTLVAQSLNLARKGEEAIEYYSKALNLSLKQKDSAFYKSISNDYAVLYLRNNALSKAKEVIDRAYPNYTYTCDQYPILIDIYTRSNQLDSAAKYAGLSLENINNYDSSGFIGLYHLLINAHEKNKNYKKAFEYSKRNLQLIDSLYNVEKASYLAEIQKKYNLKEYTEKDKKKVFQQYVLFISFMVVQFILFYLIFTKKKKNYLYIHRELENELFLLQNSISSIDDKLETRISTIKKLIELINIHTDENSNLLKIKDFIEDIKNRNSLSELLVGIIELYTLKNNKFHTTLIDKYKLTEEEYRICGYIDMGFKSSHIALIMGREERYLFNNRSTIINKLQPKNPHKLKLETIISNIKSTI